MYWKYVLILSALVALCLGALSDPYKELGVSKSASTQDIRRAYKQLAKEWHPDKSNHPDAEQKFVRINKAYELLSDSDRRRLYDRHGITSEDSHYLKQKHDYSGYNRFGSDPVEEFFGKHFNFDQDISLYHKLSITSNYFDQTVLPKSKNKLHIVMFYNDWCFGCIRIVGAFKKLIDTFEPLGVTFATVNAAHEPAVLRKSGADDIPRMVLVLSGHCYVYRENIYTQQKLAEFIRKKMPFKIGQRINDDNIDEFLNGWQDNRVRALVLEPRSVTRLRYLISAFAFHERVAFGFVDLTSQYCKQLLERFKVNPKLDTLFLFNEDSVRAVASISMADIPTQTLDNIIAANQYLSLPRLSSQEVLEGVCPAEWNRPRKRLCVVLITENSPEYDMARGALRHIALESGYSMDRVRFAYMFKEKQADFLNAISKGSFEDNLLRLVVIWRRDSTQIKYEWVDGAKLDIKSADYNNNSAINATKHEINLTIQRLLKTSEALTYEAFVQNLLDEHAQGILSKWITRLLYMADYLSDNVEDEHLFAALSLLGTIAFMFTVGYIMMYFVRAEEESLKAQGAINEDACKNKLAKVQPELKLYELRAEKYNGLVRLLKPGCRTILLITDLQSRTKLIPPFHRAVWPYRRTKTLLFGHMLIEKGLPWYTELLRLSLCTNQQLQINPRNCVGTVIALNGHRKYFCVYHAKHPECARGNKRMIKMTKQLLDRNDDPEIGNFLGVNYSEDSESETNVLFEDNLLDGLSNWLDRLFEGTTHRYYINYWPDFPTN